MSMNEVSEWADFFNRMFGEARKAIMKQYKLEKDGSGAPESLSIREAVANFPCPVRIAEIKIDTKKHKHIEDEVCQIVRYDFSRSSAGEGFVQYYGLIDEKQSNELKELLVKNFDLNEDFCEDFCRDFRTIGWCDNETSYYAQFSLYNIRKNFEKFVFDFLFHAFSCFAQKIVQESKKGFDWNSNFNLKPNLVLPISELTKMDKTLSVFPPFSKGAGIEILQKDICDIQLISSVHEDVKRVFRHAKDLHVYGFFCYDFFAIAQHYAYLALESAIKNRYYQSFGQEVTLENRKGETIRIGRVDHQMLIDFCRRRRGWNVHALKINGEKFALGTGELLNWLVRRGVITMWERKQCNKGMRLRHLMSHLTRSYVFPPSYSVQALEFVADIINKLYSTSEPRTGDNSKPVFPVDFSPWRTR